MQRSKEGFKRPNETPHQKDMIYTQNIADQYRITVKNKFQELELEDKDPEDIWEDMKSTVQKAAEEHVPKACKKRESHWLSTRPSKLQKRGGKPKQEVIIIKQKD